MTQAATAPADVPYFNVADPAFSVQSEEVRRAREQGWYARTNYGIAVLRHDEVKRLLKHPRLRQGSARWPEHHGITTGPFAEWWANWVLNKEGEDHHRLRRLMNPAFSRRLISGLVPRFRALAGELVDGFAEPDRCEFVSEFAEPYAARVIAIMLGLPEEEWPVIARDSATIGLAMGVTIAEDLPKIEAALDTLYGYVDELIDDRLREPRDDFVTRLVQAERDQDRLSRVELRDSMILLIFGGFDTTRNQLGLAMQTFLRHPDQWRLLGERPELGAAAVEEVMRVDPTTTWVTREALDDFTFEGVDIAAGTTVHLFTESAGTDPRAVPDGRFDITAERPPHFGFGGGAHHCLGHFVARCDMSEALPLLARRMRDPRPGGEARSLPLSGNTGPITLPIAFTPGS
ncbi:cytochrome P450 [Actinomadura viridis]|uniref:Cytochrome P450 n=1 Tax=Actinomadura viridis TaxID=58110 RepID=A0A931DEI7_9ACTN|nr:cytochrome P450 [Actinomadura viridis]MBG6087727.1 cytochrome P450 [Actinomadura viridis]